jgi:hypothetical protein
VGTGELVSVTCLVGLGYASYEVASIHFRWIYEAVLFAAILSARGTHTKSVLGIQLVKVKKKIYPVWIRKKPAASLWSPLLLERAAPALFVESCE